MDIKSFVPLREGYRFDGYDAKGEAKWSEIVCNDVIDTSHSGADDSLVPKEDTPISVTDEVGDRGEAVYTLKTVYTDITVDCKKDAAYSYGLHFFGDFGSDAEYYRDRGTSIEVYMVRGQDGRIYVYGEVTDPDIVVNDEIMGFKPHYCDGLHPYVDYDNYGQFSSKIGLITADGSGRYLHRAPKGCAVEMTEKGFRFEYAFDNEGKPFLDGDIFGFNFFYNDTNEYVDLGNYKRTLLKLPSRLNPKGTPFEPISAEFDDAIRVSDESATGVFSLSEKARPPKSGDMLADIVSGAVSTAIIYDDLAPAHTVIAAKRIWKRLRAYGVRASFGKRNGEDAVIRVGGGDVEYNRFRLSFDENEVRIDGWLEDGVNESCDLLLSALDYVYHGGKGSELAPDYEGEVANTPLVPQLDGLSTVTDGGEGAYLLLRLDADPSDCDAYTEKLIRNGYRKYTEKTMVSVNCATYVNESTVINVTYGERDRSLRIVAEPLKGTALPMLTDGEYTRVCRPYIAQLATRRMAWMCYVIRLENGEFLVIDSGGNGAGDYLYSALMRLNGGEPVTVACWLITHFHQDHVGGLVSLAANDEYMKNIRIKTLIHNFPQKQVLDTATGSGDRRNISMWDDTLNKIGATVYRARTGQKYFFGGAELEMLFTYEDLMPFNIYAVRTNPTSHIVSVKVGGQRFMILGDACREATELCVLRYGETLKSDFVQLSHHGWGDGGTSEEFYRLVGAPYVLYPSVTYSPKPAEEMACKMARKYFLDPQNDIILDLPYSED